MPFLNVFYNIRGTFAEKSIELSTKYRYCRYFLKVYRYRYRRYLLSTECPTLYIL